MKILYLDVWDSEEVRNSFYKNILETNPDKVVFLAHQEIIYDSTSNLKDLHKILEWNKKHNKILYVTTLAYPHCGDIVDDHIKVYHWIDWYIKKVFCICLHKCRNLNDSDYINLNFYKKSLQFKEFKYFLTSLNYNGHPHRMLMIDLMAKNNLIENNAITWHNIKCAGHETYTFRYFKEQVLQLTNNFGPDWDNPPDQYYESFVQLISESSDKISCFSEKTVMALLCFKPFLIAGPRGIHKKLQDLGFKLYTELFDYSFDNEIEEEKRYQMIMNNFKNLRTLYGLDNGKSLQTKILPKLIYNFNHVKHIAFDFSTIPDVVLELREFYKKEQIDYNKYINSVLDTLETEKMNFLLGCNKS